MSDRLRKTITRVDSSVSDEIIDEWLSLNDIDKKLLALLTIRQKIEIDSISSSQYFDAAIKLLGVPDNDCKWQAFIIVGNFLTSKPEECWQIILNYGNSNDEDTRAAVATILLEHYFEQNPHLFDEKFRELRGLIKKGNPNLLKTLQFCRSEWGSELNHATVDRFVENTKSSV